MAQLTHNLTMTGIYLFSSFLPSSVAILRFLHSSRKQLRNASSLEWMLHQTVFNDKRMYYTLHSGRVILYTILDTAVHIYHILSVLSFRSLASGGKESPLRLLTFWKVRGSD